MTLLEEEANCPIMVVSTKLKSGSESQMITVVDAKRSNFEYVGTIDVVVSMEPAKNVAFNDEKFVKGIDRDDSSCSGTMDHKLSSARHALLS
jgi:hypothetical protein